MRIFPKPVGKRQPPAKTVDQAMEVFRAIDPKAIEYMASQASHRAELQQHADRFRAMADEHRRVTEQFVEVAERLERALRTALEA